jgi:hypothetical protein
MIQTFSALATISGYEVIENATGHTVACRDSLQSANSVAQDLNRGGNLNRPAIRCAADAYDESYDPWELSV